MTQILASGVSGGTSKTWWGSRLCRHLPWATQLFHSPSLYPGPVGCVILKNWEKQEPAVVPALRGSKPNWEISLDMRREDQLSKSELEHRGTGGRKGGSEGPGANSSMTNAALRLQASH